MLVIHLENQINLSFPQGFLEIFALLYVEREIVFELQLYKGHATMLEEWQPFVLVVVFL